MEKCRKSYLLSQKKQQLFINRPYSDGAVFSSQPISCRQPEQSVSDINGSLFSLSSVNASCVFSCALNRNQKRIFDIYENRIWFGWITHSRDRFCCLLYRLQQK